MPIHTHHKRLSRKQLRQPDEFQTFFGRAHDFLGQNLKQVLVLAAVVLLAGAAALGVRAYQRHRDRMAGDQFYAALSALDQKHYGEARAGFEKLAQDDPGREAGRLARLYLGACYAEEGELAKAREAFAAYLGASRDPLFRSLALAGLAVVYERMGDLKKAQEAYARAAEVRGPEQARAELGSARLRARQGDRAGAIQAYQRFLDTHPFSAERGTVLDDLAELGAAPAPAAPARR